MRRNNKHIALFLLAVYLPMWLLSAFAKEPLCAALALRGAPVGLLRTVMDSVTLDGVIPVIREAGFAAVWTDLCRAASRYASARVRGALRVDALMLDARGQILGEWNEGAKNE